MRKMKLLAGIVLSVITVFTSVGAVKAEEGTVTDGPKIKVDIETEAEERQISEEYFEALKQYLGWDFGENKVSVQTSDTVSFTFDLEASGLVEGDVSTLLFTEIPPCYRDSNGKLKFAESMGKGHFEIAYAQWNERDGRWGNHFSTHIGTDGKNTYTLENTKM